MSDSIVKQVAQKKQLGDFTKHDKLRFRAYQFTIEEIFTILQTELDDLPEPDLQEYKRGLNEIGGGFYDLYTSSISGALKKDIIQPLLDKAGTKLSTAISFKSQGREEEYLDRLKECRSLLFDLKEYLMTINFDKPSS